MLFDILADGYIQKAIDGLFQAIAVRAAGFSIVPLSETAPALQFLYVVMMVCWRVPARTVPSDLPLYPNTVLSCLPDRAFHSKHERVRREIHVSPFIQVTSVQVLIKYNSG